MTRDEAISRLANSNIETSVFKYLMDNFLTHKTCKGCKYFKESVYGQTYCDKPVDLFKTENMFVRSDFYCNRYKPKD